MLPRTDRYYKNNTTKYKYICYYDNNSILYKDYPSDEDIFVATETGDRFDTLAYQYYNDSTLWWIIACANNIHNASIGFAEGTILRIPQNYIEIVRNFTK